MMQVQGLRRIRYRCRTIHSTLTKSPFGGGASIFTGRSNMQPVVAGKSKTYHMLRCKSVGTRGRLNIEA